MQKAKNIEILENTSLDIPSLIDDLRFKYQYSLRYQSNHAAFSKKNENGNYIMCCCPNHTETRPSFGISKTPPYHTHCFCCGYLGTIDCVIETTFLLEQGSGLKALLSNYNFEDNRKPLDITKILVTRRKCIKANRLSEETLKKLDEEKFENQGIYNVALSYLINQRGINMKTLDTYEIKIDVRNKCIVFPQRTRNGDLRFLQKRKIGSNYNGSKFINEGLPNKKDILFGLHLINQLRTSANRIKRVRIVESPIDVMSNYQVGIPAVAINGKLLFKKQIRELHLAGIEIVDLFFDNDKAGKDATQKATKHLIQEGFTVNHTLYPPQFTEDSKIDSNDLLKMGLLDKLNTISISLLSSKF
ncbi:TPA: toprim domain-containing protein [Bacillus cereus]|nr:toprim domain-containing protein [Bacillus cereus]